MSTPTTNLNEAPGTKGHDGPVTTRSRDFLNRWPFSCEIYRIATTSDKDWSVRIGIYGEWGTGKTSVLKFVDSMAEKDGHIVIWFNPWEHNSKEALWHAFVLSIFAEPRLAKIPGAITARAKGLFSRVFKGKAIAESGAALLNEQVGKGVGAGLDLLKSFVSFSRKDIQSLQAALGGKRVIVLIDDLDRTSSDLVPEILFALKELMDIPGFSFVCAFDPVVVGEVLGEYHPGFGDGLKFLDKIIDYPRWLPPPTVEGLTKLALAEARLSCKFVPESSIADAIPLLPPNPRTVRQFIRLLALLRPQIQRHYDYELHWSAILGANLIKIRHPRISHELLSDESFWDSVGVIGLSLRGEDEQKKLGEAVDGHVQNICKKLGIELELSQQNEVKEALSALCSKVNIFTGLHGESIAYQFNIGEAPAAVTWKEFDAFLLEWESNPVTPTIAKWMDRHALIVDRPDMDVYREILRAATQRYGEALQKADYVFAASDLPPFVKQAHTLFALLNSLVFELGQITQPVKWIGPAELKMLVEKFSSFVSSSLTVHGQFWPNNEKFIVRLVREWAPDVLPLLKLLDPFSGMHLGHYGNPAGAALHKTLCAVAVPNYAQQLIASFREPDFVSSLMSQEVNTYEARCLLWDAQSPLWSKYQSELFQTLGEAVNNRAVQENAHELLHWLVLAHAGHANIDPKQMAGVFSSQARFDAIWQAATVNPLAPRSVAHIKELPKILKTLGINFTPPPWWQGIMSTLIIPAQPAVAANTATTEPEEPSAEETP